MSVLIKGIEMPREKKTTLTIFPDGRVYKNNGERLWGHGEDCIPWKAVPVPPHGRLGDLDALRKRIEENIDAAKKAGNYEWWYVCTVALDFALAAPAVIDAEEGE
jgi:hypothetical protein